MATPKTPTEKDTPKSDSPDKPKDKTPETPPAPEKPAPTPEELEVESQEFLKSQFGIPPVKKEKPEAPKAEPKKEEPPKEEKATEAPEKPDAAKEPPKKRYAPAKKSDTDVAKVEEIARRVVDERTPPPPAPKKDEAEPSETDIENLSDQDRDTLDVMSEMEQSDPTRYAGLRKKVVKFWKSESDYKKKWETENPGETFDSKDPSHAAFYKKSEPQYSPRDFTQASRSIIAKSAAEKAKEELRKEYEPQFAEIKADKARKEAEPKIAESVLNAVEEVFKAAPEFEKLFEPGNLTEDAVKKMAEANPIVHHHASEEAELVMGVVGELERLTMLGEHHKFDPAMKQTLGTGRTIYPHAMISEAWQDLEKRMYAAPSSETNDHGREFVTTDEFAARADAIKRLNISKEEQNRRFEALDKGVWRISPAHVRNFIISQSGGRVKAIAKKFGNLTKSPEKAASEKNGKHTEQPEPDKPTAKSNVPRGTSTATSSDTADNSAALGGGGEDSTKEFLKSAFGV